MGDCSVNEQFTLEGVMVPERSNEEAVQVKDVPKNRARDV
jgi:hypothetical protein